MCYEHHQQPLAVPLWFKLNDTILWFYLTLFPIMLIFQFTLSGLLNIIDGLWSSCGDERIIVFTTNHKDPLDPALLRPGRMDMHLHMSYCTMDGFKLLASNLWSTGAFRDSGAGADARLGNFWKKWVRVRQDSAIKKLLKIFLQYMFNILLSILLLFHII